MYHSVCPCEKCTRPDIKFFFLVPKLMYSMFKMLKHGSFLTKKKKSFSFAGAGYSNGRLNLPTDGDKEHIGKDVTASSNLYVS